MRPVSKQQRIGVLCILPGGEAFSSPLEGPHTSPWVPQLPRGSPYSLIVLEANEEGITTQLLPCSPAISLSSLSSPIQFAPINQPM